MTDRARLTTALADRYRIERELGAGGMATVYLAHDVRHDRRVALKVLRPELSAILGAERFLHEIKTTANLQHPHILSLFDSGEADGLVYYVMPYVEGESLRDRLTREKQLPVNDAIRIAREVADALEYAHQHGVVHRDIKPENILLHGGHAMVADFGIALAASRSEGGTRMTETGMSLGTPFYMSPEQAMGEREITPKADIYALGCVLYEMLTAEPPFVGATAQAIIARVMTEEPRSLTLQRHTIPPNVEAAVRKALEKLPADRFATAAEFGAALTDGAWGQGSTGARTVRPTVRQSARLPWALATLAVVFGAAGWFGRSTDAPVRRYALSLPDSQELSSSTDYRLALSPDGGSFVYRGAGNRLWLRRRDELLATPLPGTEGGFNASFSPDGTRLAFIAGTPRGVKVLTLGSSTVTVLTDSLVDRGGVSWGYDGFIYYDGHLAGDGVARIRETGGAPEVFSMPRADSGEAYHVAPHAMPDGRHLLFSVRLSRGTNLWQMAVADIRTGRHTVIGPGVAPRYSAAGFLVYVNDGNALLAAPFDASSARMTGPAVEIGTSVALRGNARADVAVAADGSLAYVVGATGEGVTELVWVDRSGTITTISSDWRGEFNRPTLSPDDRQLAVGVGREGGSDIWVKRLDGGPPSRLTFEGINGSPTWLDANRLLFVQNSGSARLATVPADGSRLPRVWHDSLIANTPAVSADGRWFTYTRAGNVYAASTDSASVQHTLLATSFTETAGRLSPDSRWLAYMSDESGTFEIYLRPFPETSVAKRQVSTAGGGLPFWSRDGRELFWITADEELWSVAISTAPALSIGQPRRLFSVSGLTGAGASAMPWLTPTRDGRRFLAVRLLGARDSRDAIVLIENLPALLRQRSRR